MTLKKKKVYEAGDIIPVEGRDRDILEHISGSVAAAHHGIIVAQEHHHEQIKKLFDTIEEMHPELKGFHLKYSHEEQFIMVLGKRNELPKMSKYLDRGKN